MLDENMAQCMDQKRTDILLTLGEKKNSLFTYKYKAQHKSTKVNSETN